MGKGTSRPGIFEGLGPGTKMIGVSPKEWPHRVFGTGAGTKNVKFPNLDIARKQMDTTVEIEESDWRGVLKDLQDREFLHVGNSTEMSVAADMRVAWCVPPRRL